MATTDPIPPPGDPPVDIEAFRDQMRDAGVDGVVSRILSTFSNDLPNQEAALRSALEAGDAAAVASIAHGFKSASGSVHAHRLQALFAALESRVTEDGTDACEALASDVVEEIARVRGYLDGLDLP